MPNTGKSALAARLAKQSDFPFVRLISPESLVGYTELAKCNAINKTFEDSYKSSLSVIVVDAIERLLDWSPIGSRFSNLVLQTLLVLLKKRPPKGKKLLVVCTTSQREVLRQMEALDSFDGQIETPLIRDLAHVRAVVRQRQLFTSAAEEDAAFSQLQAETSGRLTPGIGIKRLLNVIDRAAQSKHVGTSFADNLLSALDR